LRGRKTAFKSSKPGLPDFSWHNIPKTGKINQMTIKFTKFPQNLPNFHKIYQISTKFTKFPQNLPNFHKIYQISTKFTKFPQNYQMTIKYTKMDIIYIPNVHNIFQHFSF
jgi:hypothetical protein